MINGEGWLKDGIKCNLKVVTLSNYDHNSMYDLPVRPSPNLPNMSAIYLYPSLGLFEGTVVSLGRGTDLPFQVIGHPTLENGDYTFTPQPKPGAMEPKYKGQLCKGYNLQEFGMSQAPILKSIQLRWLIKCYNNTPDKSSFFDMNFNYHAGNATLQQQIKDGISENEIHKSWEEGIKKFKTVRKKYLLYKDFE
jgi:uncharacterized protein YbbC (DUF1343 family)